MTVHPIGQFGKKSLLAVAIWKFSTAGIIVLFPAFVLSVPVVRSAPFSQVQFFLENGARPGSALMSKLQFIAIVQIIRKVQIGQRLAHFPI
jgi:hypothetical protein